MTNYDGRLILSAKSIIEGCRISKFLGMESSTHGGVGGDSHLVDLELCTWKDPAFPREK